MHFSDETVRKAALAVQLNARFESPVEHDFFDRVFNTPHSVYRRRLECIGMAGKKRVLDVVYREVVDQTATSSNRSRDLGSELNSSLDPELSSTRSDCSNHVVG